MKRVLQITKISRSFYYKTLRSDSKIDGRKDNSGRALPGYCWTVQGQKLSDEHIVEAVMDYRLKPYFENAGGYRKLKYYLKRDHSILINHKKVYRLCRENDLLLPKKKKKKRCGRKLCVDRAITQPHQLWQFDIKYGYIDGENRFFFLMGFIDVFHREIMGYHIGLRCQASDIIFTLDEVLQKHGVDPSGLVIRSDNGSQMTSHQFRRYVEGLGLEHEFTPPSTPDKNAFIESFFAVFEAEFLQTHRFETYEEAYIATMNFIQFYNKRRLHGSLKFMSPKEFFMEWTKKNNYEKQNQLAA